MFKNRYAPAPPADKPFGDVEDGKAVDLRGTVEQVRVFNEGDGWGFGKLFTKGRTIAFTGLVGALYEGGDVRVQGVWQEHPRFGWQIKARLLVSEVPDTAFGARAWLEHRFHDIGPVLSGRLVAAFPPPELWRVIEEEPTKLLAVEGVGQVRLDAIAQAYQAWAFEREQFEALAALSLSPAQIQKAVARWGREARALITENPYILMDLPGVGWKFADAAARKLGIKRADDRRVVAGLVYAMLCRERDGHTCGSAKGLRAAAAGVDILSLPIGKVAASWDSVLERRALIEAHGAFYRPETLRREQALARGIAALLGKTED